MSHWWQLPTPSTTFRSWALAYFHISLWYVSSSVFFKKQYNFSKNQCEKMSCPSSIRHWDLNPWPLKHESSSLTTRPGDSRLRLISYLSSFKTVELTCRRVEPIRAYRSTVCFCIARSSFKEKFRWPLLVNPTFITDIFWLISYFFSGSLINTLRS